MSIPSHLGFSNSNDSSSSSSCTPNPTLISSSSLFIRNRCFLADVPYDPYPGVTVVWDCPESPADIAMLAESVAAVVYRRGEACKGIATWRDSLRDNTPSVGGAGLSASMSSHIALSSDLDGDDDVEEEEPASFPTRDDCRTGSGLMIHAHVHPIPGKPNPTATSSASTLIDPPAVGQGLEWSRSGSDGMSRSLSFSASSVSPSMRSSSGSVSKSDEEGDVDVIEGDADGMDMDEEDFTIGRRRISMSRSLPTRGGSRGYTMAYPPSLSSGTHSHTSSTTAAGYGSYGTSARKNRFLMKREEDDMSVGFSVREEDEEEPFEQEEEKGKPKWDGMEMDLDMDMD
ncbi:hypothetical protein B0H34DRAFT_860568 [Crassisporium funariophilum]|nr:hypothetical protein B0H34DRAFT_860568 [Crassisporium funariophilum]